MQIGPVGLKLIEEFEGLRLEAYQDSVGVWTIGYGTTAGAGVDVHAGMTCTQAQAEAWLKQYVDQAVIPAIEQAWEQRRTYLHATLNPNENRVDALCSLGYNLGAGIFQATHTIGYDIRHGHSMGKIGDDFLLYEDAGGQRLAGLVTRREAERALFARPMSKHL